MSTSTANRAVIDREQLVDVAVDLIDRDSAQPRTIFVQGELDELAACQVPLF